MATQLSGTRRNRAILIVRGVTLGGAFSALGLTWLFSNMAEAYFSGKPPNPQPPPKVPVSTAPVQQPPTVITTIVHHPASAAPPARSGPAPAPAPRPPAQGPAAPPAPPPPPVCHSTPSKPC
jgi:hypothetical protein